VSTGEIKKDSNWETEQVQELIRYQLLPPHDLGDETKPIGKPSRCRGAGNGNMPKKSHQLISCFRACFSPHCRMEIFSLWLKFNKQIPKLNYMTQLYYSLFEMLLETLLMT
jgi:hypothetical protein